MKETAKTLRDRARHFRSIAASERDLHFSLTLKAVAAGIERRAQELEAERPRRQPLGNGAAARADQEECSQASAQR